MDKKEIALSTGTIPPPGVVELGLVTGSCVVSTSIFGDALAAVRNMSVGGELKQYTELLRTSTEKAMERLGEKAFEKGADGVYAIQFMTPQVAGGAAEVVAVGTAYKFDDK
ncbi:MULTISPECIES: YbjQ family protein [unclassified Pyramidobacter]|uniref:YbjQ family protein n=1 Tax=unclassified Pyramidobacter TaxID=2632171 RepID=UPI000EA27DAF|nr:MULTISPECIES: heavy metal-binding domain-containing protein [unclassified Pyramidobacter]MCI7402551.1 YbjQ family protein [Pyramidobacter sp.]MDY3212082.1 heavy metal-binding domain-containing protein [Pyramidobacter sp.]RKJ78363.1 YbjQ family protein [Pyramidobacter sp. CG50-2]